VARRTAALQLMMLGRSRLCPGKSERSHQPCEHRIRCTRLMTSLTRPRCLAQNVLERLPQSSGVAFVRCNLASPEVAVLLLIQSTQQSEFSGFTIRKICVTSREKRVPYGWLVSPM